MTDDSGLGPTLRQNIEAFDARRRENERAAGLTERLSLAITSFAGSMRFVVAHALMFGFWIIANVRVIPGIKPFDPSLVFLATFASVEAIFISTFVLIAQNRMAVAADRRAELDLHVSLLAENELTRLADLTARIAAKVGVEHDDPGFAEVTRMVDPVEVLNELERREGD